MSPEAQGLIQLSAGRTAYELTGPENAPLAVLVHGFSVPSYIWDPTLPALLAAGQRVLRYDLYGRGGSDRPKVDYNADLFDRQLFELLDGLGIQKPASLVGLSMGGPISAEFTRRRPERVERLVLVDPAGFVDWKTIPIQLLRLPLLGEWLMNRFGRKMIVDSQPGDFHHPDRFPLYAGLARQQMERPGYLPALLSTLRKGPLGEQSELYRQVGQLGKPVLLIWGKEDRSFPVALTEKALALLPGASLQVIPDSGHIPHYEHPELVNPLLVDFLRNDRTQHS